MLFIIAYGALSFGVGGMDILYSPGGVDLQINGALGLAFNNLQEGDRPKLAAVGRFLWQQGMDAYLPTLVTTSVPQIQRSLAVLAPLVTIPAPQSAQILGVHLEGPFLNPQKRGAHPQEHLLPLTMEHLRSVLGDFAPLVRLITLAPELDPTGHCLDWLVSQGIAVSLGHTTATLAEANGAFDRGAIALTHTFNAMPPLHHRQPGILAAALLRPEIFCGVIADGIHVDPAMLRVLYQLTGGPASRLFIVSDALAPLGLPEGVHPWDHRSMTIQDGTARLADGTLCGSTQSLLSAVPRLVRWGVCSLSEAITLATLVPRRLLGLGAVPPQAIAWQQGSSGEISWHRVTAATSPQSA